jgi:mono/diheme cytochrome c family protein
MHFDEKDGESLYRNICQGCHMPDGQGASGAGRYPALAGNPRLAAKAYPVFMVTHGQRAMPGFGEQLDDAQIAEVVNYVRTHLGNGYTDAVTPAEVKAARK